jgi:hypothetical protein
MPLQVTTDHKYKDFKYRDEVPPAILESQFDWTNEDYLEHGSYSDGFICYRGFWYHVGDFMVDTPPSLDVEWQGFAADSFFSGVAIAISDDGEQYKIATVIATSS